MYFIELMSREQTGQGSKHAWYNLNEFSGTCILAVAATVWNRLLRFCKCVTFRYVPTVTVNTLVGLSNLLLRLYSGWIESRVTTAMALSNDELMTSFLLQCDCCVSTAVAEALLWGWNGEPMNLSVLVPFSGCNVAFVAFQNRQMVTRRPNIPNGLVKRFFLCLLQFWTDR